MTTTTPTLGPPAAARATLTDVARHLRTPGIHVGIDTNLHAVTIDLHDRPVHVLVLAPTGTDPWIATARVSGTPTRVRPYLAAPDACAAAVADAARAWITEVTS